MRKINIIAKCCQRPAATSIIHREPARNCSFLLSSEDGDVVHSLYLMLACFFPSDAQIKQYFALSRLNRSTLIWSRT